MTMNAVPPPEAQSYGSQFDAEIEACCKAITSMANDAATSQDAETKQRLGQGTFAFAQAISLLMPVKPDPNVTTKVTGDMVKEGAKLAAAEHRAAESSGTQAKIGAKDG